MLVGLVAVVALAAGVSSHAVVESPPPRRVGPASRALCGPAVTHVNERDRAGPIEAAVKEADSAYKCDAFKCRGYQWEDNKDRLLQLKPGQDLNLKINLVAGHQPGTSNVSIIDLATNKAIGAPLKDWPAWPLPCIDCGDLDYNVTIPTTLGKKCAVGGQCAIQWWWNAQKKQTYESCLDFILV